MFVCSRHYIIFADVFTSGGMVTMGSYATGLAIIWFAAIIIRGSKY